MIVPRDTVPKGTRVYGTRWVDTTKKRDDGSIVEKSRLVAQNYKDYQSRETPTKAPTISRFGQRLCLCIGAMYPDMTPFTRDITQAYTQSKDTLLRKVYLQPPKEMRLPYDQVLLAVKPLYGIPESGLYWFITYRDHHVNELKMTSCTVDKCILYRHYEDGNNRTLPALTILQVDDSFGLGIDEFLNLEEEKSSAFKTKPRQCLKPGDSCAFNGSKITREQSRTYSLTQSEKLSTLRC